MNSIKYSRLTFGPQRENTTGDGGAQVLPHFFFIFFFFLTLMRLPTLKRNKQGA